MVTWPAIIKFAGADDLTFVSSSDALNNHPDLLGAAFHAEDVLIDAAGAVFQLRQGPAGVEVSAESAAGLTLDDVIDLVRRHASVRGECCIGKISAPSIAVALGLVGEMAPR